jgi:hypothetical protein
MFLSRFATFQFATTNPDDFQAFVPHGLKLRSI